MYTLQPETKSTLKKRNNVGCIAVILLLTVGIVTFGVMTAPYRASTPSGTPARVTLRAEPWNNGRVHLWARLSESDDTHTDISEEARCTRLDAATYKLGSGSTAIYYYKLKCNGMIGYVQSDQVE